MSFALARAHHDVLAGASIGASVTRRGRDGIAGLRERYPFAESPSSATYAVQSSGSDATWWTFAGFAANSALAQGLTDIVDPSASVSELRLRLRRGVTASELRDALQERADALPGVIPGVEHEMLAALKFSEAVPVELARETVARRLADPAAVGATVMVPVRTA
jgi:ATP-dependent helicase Lhr and Lhr-like helicase